MAVNFLGGENQRKPLTCRKLQIKKLYHIILYQVYLSRVGFELTKLVVIGTDCTGSCKSNYNMIMATTAFQDIRVMIETIRFF